MVAAGRAVETHRSDGLVNDPYAELFVAKADTSLPVPTRAGEPWPDPERVGDETTVVDELWSLMSAYQGVRSRSFDMDLLDATHGGATQVVLLAAGLDARAYRLDWPAGTTVFEVDQPQVMEFKNRVLAESGDEPRCVRRSVPVDLREDWPSALRAAGFDPAQPSVWLAEGLLPFLPAEAEAELFRLIGTLTTPGSRVVVEDFRPGLDQMRAEPALTRFAKPFGIDMLSLVDLDQDRTHPADRLRADGWDVRTDSAVDRAQSYGRSLAPELTGLQMDNHFVSARR